MTRPASVHVETVAGAYSITAAKWSKAEAPATTTTTHVVRVEPGQAINLTLSV